MANDLDYLRQTILLVEQQRKDHLSDAAALKALDLALTTLYRRHSLLMTAIYGSRP